MPVGCENPSSQNAGSIAVVIVNYATADLAIAAVDSVLGHNDHGLVSEIHVVDNASPGQDQQRLTDAATNWPAQVVLHLERENHGFGRGNNLALRCLAQNESPPDAVLFLNPDARLRTDVVSQLWGFLDERPACGIAGCAIRSMERNDQLVSAFRFPSFLSEFSAGAKIGLVSRLLRGHEVPLHGLTRRQRVDWVSGAAFMAQFSALKAVDFFDADYFLYFEETDMMRRIGKSGWEIWYCPEAQVDHAAGASTGMSSEKGSDQPIPGYWFDSWRLYFVKNHGVSYARLCAVTRLAGGGLHRVYAYLLGRAPGTPPGFLRDFRGRVLGPLFRSGRARS